MIIVKQFHYVVLFILTVALAQTVYTKSVSETKDIENYATIETYCDKVPVYAFGYTYVYGISPDLLLDIKMQQNNMNPIEKIQPKKTWEIGYNLCGSTPAREPKSMWNDDQPLLPIHLIDGNPETVWSSRGGTVSDIRPEWIRIDLPAEQTLKSVSLITTQNGPSNKPEMRIGKTLPNKLTIKLSRDGVVWDTVYENSNFTESDSGYTLIHFEPRTAKMVWIIGENLEKAGLWGYSFSIAEVEIHNMDDINLALVSQGAGIQVSSTHFGYGMDRFTQEMLWPIQYDLGFKWTRVGYDMGMYLWSYVEREKGKLQIDPKADEAVTEAFNNGMNVILCLDKGNWLYREPPKKTDWKHARIYEMMETYYDHQGWPYENEEMLQGYLRYVDYMVRHFKGRVAYYEICNEWHIVKLEDYLKVVWATIPVIEKADPNARIMLGSVGGFDTGRMLSALCGKELKLYIKDGKLEMWGKTIAIKKEIVGENLTVSVDAYSNAEAGIILRWKDPDNFLLAIYTENNGIYFHEVVNGEYSAFYGMKETPGLGPNIHLDAEINGTEVMLTVSDNHKSFTTKYNVVNVPRSGAVGLFHNLVPSQKFDNFRVKDSYGKIFYEDSFDCNDGDVTGWDTDREKVIEYGNLAPRIDAIGWHPFYQADPDLPNYRRYRQDIEQFKNDCKALGFQGDYVASEWTWVAPYPGHTDWCTEMSKAKYSARLMTAHCGMNIISLFNETFQTGRLDWDVTLLRNSSFQVDPITPAQPQPIYYVLRNISTVMDNFRPTKFPVEFEDNKEFECYTFQQPNGNLMFAAWIPGRTKDGIVESQCDITLPNTQIEKAWVVDVFNGTKQELNIGHQGNSTTLNGMLIKDYPVFVLIQNNIRIP